MPLFGGVGVIYNPSFLSLVNNSLCFAKDCCRYLEGVFPNMNGEVFNEVEQFHEVSIHHENGKLLYVLFDDIGTHYVVHHNL
mgnify:FL=1